MAFRLLCSLGFFISCLSLAGCGDDAFAEIAEDSPDPEFLAYVPDTEKAGLVATDVYGPLYVDTGRFVAEAEIKPWSSWWFPISEDTLFKETSDGDLSPLQKYDRYCRTVLQTDTNAADFERARIYKPNAPGWAGLCDAWAIASIMEPEPKQAVDRNGIHFTVADLKALLLKTYERAAELTHFGNRNDAQWNDEYADIDPHQFHRFLQVEMFEKKSPFVMDHDAGYEVWSCPVWKAVTKIDRSTDQPDIVHVQTWLLSASPHVNNRNFTGTLQVVNMYTYDLIGQWEADNRFLVTSSRWTERSRWDHPDFLIVKPSSLTRQSRNPQIDVAAVDAILGRTP
jgi:hypothetical protein